MPNGNFPISSDVFVIAIKPELIQRVHVVGISIIHVLQNVTIRELHTIPKLHCHTLLHGSGLNGACVPIAIKFSYYRLQENKIFLLNFSNIGEILHKPR